MENAAQYPSTLIHGNFTLEKFETFCPSPIFFKLFCSTFVVTVNVDGDGDEFF